MNKFLKGLFRLLIEITVEEEPLITIAYHLKDGTDKTISANDTTVWWKNKAYALKDQELFVNLTEGVFFMGAHQAA